MILCSAFLGPSRSAHLMVNLYGLWKLRLVHVVDLGHMPLPVVLSGESLASRPRIIAILDRAVELLLLLVPVVDVALKMRLRAESFPAVWIRTLVIFDVVSLVMPGR